jgi:hypothetical protein
MKLSFAESTQASGLGIYTASADDIYAAKMFQIHGTMEIPPELTTHSNSNSWTTKNQK